MNLKYRFWKTLEVGIATPLSAVLENGLFGAVREVLKSLAFDFERFARDQAELAAEEEWMNEVDDEPLPRSTGRDAPLWPRQSELPQGGAAYGAYERSLREEFEEGERPGFSRVDEPAEPTPPVRPTKKKAS